MGKVGENFGVELDKSHKQVTGAKVHVVSLMDICHLKNAESEAKHKKKGRVVLRRSQGPKRQLRISKQSPLCSRGAESSHPMDPGVSVQKQNFTRNPEKLAVVPGTRKEA